MYKVIAVVKFNDREALALSENPIIKYEEYGSLLLGLDQYGIFANSYYLGHNCGSFRAFGGREFEIPMTDGTFKKAHGQYWDDGRAEFEEILGSEIIGVTIKEIHELNDCYVFYGMSAVKSEYDKLRATYTGKVYEYYEYEKILKEELSND